MEPVVQSATMKPAKSPAMEALAVNPPDSAMRNSLGDAWLAGRRSKQQRSCGASNKSSLVAPNSSFAEL
jgi:hypothetical protein